MIPVTSTTVTRALHRQDRGFLAPGFSHTLNPYKGCAFGEHGCPFCYVRASPAGRFGPTAWGTWVVQKTNIAAVLAAELRPPRARQYRVFMSSATDPYQAAEARARLSRRCLEVFRASPVTWLVVQTRSLLVRDDFALLAQLPFVTLNVSIETDRLDIHRRFTRGAAAPERRLQLVQEALARGIATQITVSPLLPSSPTFAEPLAQALGARGRVIVDNLMEGDGTKTGQRSRMLGMDARLTAAGFPGCFEHCQAHARALWHRLRALLGPARVLWSAEGFCTPWQEPAARGEGPGA